MIPCWMSRRSRVLVLGWLFAPLLGACSVFSGWSDLQGGELESEDGGSSTDAGSSAEDSGRRDASRGDALPSPDVDGDPCAEAVCNGSSGCCVQGNARACTTEDECTGNGGFFLRCRTSAECGAGSSCCLALGELMAQCAPSCELGDYVLCDPAGNDCNATCSAVGFAGVFRCR